MFLAGAKNLEAKKEWINELNVFPVPDGDTGTNMTLTIMSAASEVGALTDPDMETLAKAISSGSLRGARGNSGVILSQLLRGFTRGVRKLNDLDAPAIAAAMERGVRFDYLLVDSWFTNTKRVRFISSRHIKCHLLGMIKLGKSLVWRL